MNQVTEFIFFTHKPETAKFLLFNYLNLSKTITEVKEQS